MFFFFQTRTFAGLSAKEWLFLVFTTLNILTAIGLTAYRLVKIIKDDKSDTSDFTFIILLLLNAGKFTCNSRDTDRAHMHVIWIFFIFVISPKN